MGNLITCAIAAFCIYVYFTMDGPTEYIEEPGLTQTERNELLWSEIGG